MLVLAEPVPAGVEAAPLRCPAGRTWSGGRGGRSGSPTGTRLVMLLTGYRGRRCRTAGSGWTPVPVSASAGFQRRGPVVARLRGGRRGGGPGARQRRRPGGHAAPGGPVLPRIIKLAVLAGWSAEAAGEVALAQWGWTLARDPEGVRHWRPRARGVSIDSERGWRFRGRTAALHRIAAWLDRARAGPEGAGGHRLARGREVRGAGPDRHHRRRRHPRLAARWAMSGPAERGVGGLRGARQGQDRAGGRRGDRPRRIRRAARGRRMIWRPAIRETLDERGGRRFNVIIDALDEAASPAQARVDHRPGRAAAGRDLLRRRAPRSSSGPAAATTAATCWTGSAAPWTAIDLDDPRVLRRGGPGRLRAGLPAAGR